MLRFNFRPFHKKVDSFPIPKKDYYLIEKETKRYSEHPIYINDHLYKVKKTPFGINLADELKEFTSETYTSGPFIQYDIKNLLVLKNRAYFGSNEYALNPLENSIKLYDGKLIEEFQSAAFSSMRISTVFFGHWLREELLLIDYLQGETNIVSTSPLTPQKSDISSFFDLKFNFCPYTLIRRATITQGWQHTDIYNGILGKFKSRIEQQLATSEYTKQPKIVYLKRGSSATKRSLINEKNLLEYLEKRFQLKVFTAESTPIEELYREVYNADIIMSIEGSQMAHAIISAKPGATLLCIQPPYRFYNPFKNYCSDAGIQYAVFVADSVGNEEDFHVKPEEMLALIDKILC